MLLSRRQSCFSVAAVLLFGSLFSSFLGFGLARSRLRQLDGPDFEDFLGTWIDPKTGDQITIRST